MNFMPKADAGPVASSMLAIAVGLTEWAGQVVPASGGVVATQVAFEEPESIQTNRHSRIVPATELTQAPGRQTVRTEHQPRRPGYKSKRWWKKNAPLVGGAGGGALIGGLAGGGKGAIVGGAVGGGGGYLYKRLRHSYHHDHQ
jgi:hypothetical protein